MLRQLRFTSLGYCYHTAELICRRNPLPKDWKELKTRWKCGFESGHFV